jgi:hypothetical protein
MCLAPRAPHSTASLGQRPRTHAPTARALKARFNYRIASQAWRYFDGRYVLGLETIRGIEARFQRLVYRTIGFLGRCPRLAL